MFSKIFAISAVLVFSVQSATAADSCARQYTVQPGDYCDKISQANNASTYQFAAVNSGKINDKCTNLVPGDSLCLGNTGEDCKTTYTVQSGDTCTKVMSGAGVNATILYLNNPEINTDCTNMYVGQVLCIASTVQVTPIPSGGVVIPVSGPPATAPSSGDGAAAATTPAPITVTAPATPAASIATPAATPSPSPDNLASSGDEDDCGDDDAADDGSDAADDEDDLPYCDEVEDGQQV